MLNYLYIFYLLGVSILMFFLSIYFLLNKLIYYMEFEILKISSVKIEFLIVFDWVAFMFISVVMVISCMVILYSMEYMIDELVISRFMFLVMLFVLSMILMIISPNLISILLGWDGLGLISYCLVIYYQNESSLNSGMVTVLINRVGDIMILMLISLLTSLGSWNFMFWGGLSEYLLMLVFLISITKSAQIPFSSWLPLAMAAPTPVSSLVHSSTLVTAGVYLLIRFNYLMNNINLLNFMMIVSILTMLISGIAANLENDLKKIIAFSTLSQLGLMIFSLSLKLVEISYFHLLTHAMFKSMLFMCAGVIIHNMLGNQDIRFISMVLYNLPLVSVLFNCSSMSLCGIPFLSGFFSKDLILEMFFMSYFSKLIFLFLFFSMGLTLSYSVRLIYYSFIKISMINYYFNYYSLSNKMSGSMIFMFFMSIIMGSSMNWLMFSMKNFIFLTLKFKLMIYLFMLMGGFLGLMISVFYFNKMFLMNFNIYMKFFMLMWFMPYLYQKILKKIFKMNQILNYNLDMGWNEYLGGVSLYVYLKNMFYYDMFNKMYFFLLIMISYIIMLMLFI